MGRLDRYELAMAAHSVKSEKPTESRSARLGRRQERPHDRHGQRRRQRDHDQEESVDDRDVDAPSGRELGRDGAVQQGTIEDGESESADDREQDDRENFTAADAEYLAKQERVDRRFVLGTRREECRSQGQHHHQRKSRDDVTLGASTGRAYAEGRHEGESDETEERIDPNEVRSGRAGECSVGDGVRRKRGTAHDDEESDGARECRDDRAADPGVGHEAREHR